MRRTVTVLQDDIDKGVPCTTSGCAIAVAVRREWHLWEVFVNPGSVACWETPDRTGGLRMHVASLPEAARKFIGDFDCGRPVEPFKFEVDLV